MRERVVIKWGGGLITDKTSLCTPDLEILDHLAQTVATCQSNDVDVVLVHGAGSFGHLRAKHWRLNEGALTDEVFENDEECSTQWEAVRTSSKGNASTQFSCLRGLGTKQTHTSHSSTSPLGQKHWT